MADSNPWQYEELIAWRRRWARLAWGEAAVLVVLVVLRLAGVLYPVPGQAVVVAFLGAIPLVSGACWAHFARLTAAHPDHTTNEETQP